MIGAVGYAALIEFAEWRDGVALVAGALMIISPWLLGFAAVGYALWAFTVLGRVVAVASLSEIWMVNHRAFWAS